MPPRKAYLTKRLEMASSDISEIHSGRPIRKASQKKEVLSSETSESLQRPSNKYSEKQSGRPSRKTSQKKMEMLPSEASPKRSGRQRKGTRKSTDSRIAIVSASQKKLESNSKAVVLRQPAICMICKKSFTSKKKLKDHNTKHHFFRHCPNCPKTFQQTREFVLHLRSHLEDHPYECKICLECFNRKIDLREHKKSLHKNPKRLHCNMCSEVFPHRSSLNRHRLVHIGQKYECVECSAIFSNVPDLTVHSKNHVYRCRSCPKEVVVFSSNIDLANHYKLVHPKMKSLEPCVSTGAVNLEEDGGSDSMEDLSSDEDDESDANVNNNYQRDAVEPVYNLKRKDKFICFICYDLYPTSELLKSHMKAHKWYPCNTCPRFFSNAETLMQHKCNLPGIPSFRCEICNTETKCEGCKKNCSEMKGDISKENLNGLQNTVSRFSELPRIPLDYLNDAYRTLLYKFIDNVKSQKEPLDLECFNLIGFQCICLGMILKDPKARCLYSEVIPYIEDLHSKFEDLSQFLLCQLNHSSA